MLIFSGVKNCAYKIVNKNALNNLSTSQFQQQLELIFFQKSVLHSGKLFVILNNPGLRKYWI